MITPTVKTGQPLSIVTKVGINKFIFEYQVSSSQYQDARNEIQETRLYFVVTRDSYVLRIFHFTILHWAFGIRKYNVPSTKYKVGNTKYDIRHARQCLKQCEEGRGGKMSIRLATCMDSASKPVLRISYLVLLNSSLIKKKFFPLS